MQRNIIMFVVGVVVFSCFGFLVFTTNSGEESFIVQGEGDDMLQEILEEEVSMDESEDNNKEKEQNKTFMVDVKGFVKHPGVYELEEGLRVIDAIEKAGGIKEKGNELHVNLAERIYDEMIIYVPEEGEDGEESYSKTFSAEEKTKKVRINYDGIEELETLPGIGPAKAEAILTYREENGLYRSKEELMKVSGIGKKSYEKLQDFITVD